MANQDFDDDPRDVQGEMRDCPLCGESIRTQAIKCRHCGEHFKKQTPGRHDPKGKAVEETSNLSLILGLIGLLVCPVLGPFAIMKANEAKRLASAARVPVPGAATGGLVTGWIGTVYLILTVLAVVGMVVLFIFAAVAGGVR